jgi:3',5'-cyclic AMP phosphodiesterase CpdA
MRIAHLSDIHFGGENPSAVAGAAAWLAAFPPDLTILTGDLTAFGHEPEFAKARAWAQTLTGPILALPGNHDTPYLGLLERLIRPFARFERSFGLADGARWANEEAIVASVNTARGAQLRWNWSKGAIAMAQVEAALANLGASVTPAARIIACHHPLAEMVAGPMTGRVRGGRKAARRFCEEGVDLVLTGHIHAPFVWPFAHGDGHTYAVGAGTLSLRERGAPPSFSLIAIEPGAIEVTALAWTGARFENWRNWSLERRPHSLGRQKI